MNPKKYRATSNAVRAIGLTVAYGRTPVLHGIDLDILDGQTVAVMGPNGAGKSTLLNSLAGCVRPTTGSVCWFNEDSVRTHHVRRQIGFAGTEVGLYSELSAMENLLFAGRMFGVINIHNRAAYLLSEGNLQSQSHLPVRQLSQGMRQRVAIIRALIHEPRLLFLDEPFAKLDADGRGWLIQKFQQWRSAGRAVCFASHEGSLCRALADRIVHIKAGRIGEIGQAVPHLPVFGALDASA